MISYIPCATYEDAKEFSNSEALLEHHMVKEILGIEYSEEMSCWIVRFSVFV